jgi:four helix bundle protein
MPYRDLNLLDAAERAAHAVNTLIDNSPRRLLYSGQMRDSAQSVGANIAEGFSRDEGPDRAYRLILARGEADETIRHLKSNFTSNRIPPKTYWPLHNLFVTIVKMITSLLRSME